MKIKATQEVTAIIHKSDGVVDTIFSEYEDARSLMSSWPYNEKHELKTGPISDFVELDK